MKGFCTLLGGNRVKPCTKSISDECGDCTKKNCRIDRYIEKLMKSLGEMSEKQRIRDNYKILCAYYEPECDNQNCDRCSSQDGYFK